MKNLGFSLAIGAALAVALNVAAQNGPDGQPVPPPAENQPPPEDFFIPVPIVPDTPPDTTNPGGTTPPNGQPPANDTAKPPESFVKEGTNTPRYVAPAKRDTNAPTPVDVSIRTPTTPPEKVIKDGEKGILMNFRNAPLEMVLTHLSDAAGFIVIPKVDVKKIGRAHV